MARKLRPQPKIVLASSSPRRIEFLQLLKWNPEILKPDVDESVLRGESPKRMVSRLSEIKAEAVAPLAAQRFNHVLVIAADTTVVDPNGKGVLGKPKDARDAVRMLKKLSGQTHTVFTGYTILERASEGDVENRLTRVVKTDVTIRKLDDSLIRSYVETGEPLDKAGSYAAQGLGMMLIERISGSYTNVVGLPMAQLLNDLSSQFGLKGI